MQPSQPLWTLLGYGGGDPDGIITAEHQWRP